MPIYEYECQACGDIQEVMQKISDPAPGTCAVCHKGPVSKIMSRSGFILKGSGWYVTDFRDSGKKPSKGADTGGGQDGAKGGSQDAAEGGGKNQQDAKPAASPSPASDGGGEGAAVKKTEASASSGCGSACAV